jgi:hypothetical protein
MNADCEHAMAGTMLSKLIHVISEQEVWGASRLAYLVRRHDSYQHVSWMNADCERARIGPHAHKKKEKKNR